MGKLKNRIALITGASRGIGLAIARALAQEGATLILVARHRAPLVQVARQLAGGRPLVADVSAPGDVRRLARQVRRHYGRLDILVNNAGVFTYKPFVRTTLRDWRASLETNLTSIFLLTQAALPLLARSRNPHLVNILSISSRQAFTNCSAYTASKFGALGLTRVLSEELRPLRMRVTAILPGPTDTHLAGAFDFPIRRARLIQPDDIAAAVLGALVQPARTNIEEILLLPSAGSL
jgi:NAD(P)-dependent dehydrogenase (short-subunit alcohol dehydrogenase family)